MRELEQASQIKTFCTVINSCHPGTIIPRCSLSVTTETLPPGACTLEVLHVLLEPSDNNLGFAGIKSYFIPNTIMADNVHGALQSWWPSDNR